MAVARRRMRTSRNEATRGRWMNSRTRDEADKGLEARVKALARTNAQLIQAQQRKDNLCTLIVHDLKSPLSGIMLNLRWLRGVEAGDDVREALGNIEAASRSMLRIVMNLLSISRSEDGALVPHKSAIDLARMVRGLVTSMSRRALEARVDLGARVPPGLTVEADGDLIGRVIENLLDNGLRYTPSGGHIAVEAERPPGADHVEIRVRDDGRGIPANERERVFERYAQVDPTRGTDGAGARSCVGLGLYFCKLAIEAHGGTIRAGANEPRGTVFRIDLPA